jgi:hypothetical protein
MLLTIAFEFVAGRSTVGPSWQKLLVDYIQRGRLWPLLLPGVCCRLTSSTTLSNHQQKRSSRRGSHQRPSLKHEDFP